VSRRIAAKASVTVTEEEKEFRKTDGSKLLFTTYEGRDCALTIQKDRLVDASFFSRDSSNIGAIYIGRVKNLAPNLDACFVEIAKGEICFLPLKSASTPYLLNRSFDGCIREGDELLVQVTRDAQKTKRASVTTNLSLSNECFAMTLGSTKVHYSLKLDQKEKEAMRKLFTEKGIFKNDHLQAPDTLLAMMNNDNTKKNYFSEKAMQWEKRVLPAMGVIVRTKAADEREAEDLLDAFFSVLSQFIELLYSASYRNCFSCLKEAPMAFEAVVRHFIAEQALETASPAISAKEISHTNSKIITDQKLLYEQLIKYCAEYHLSEEIKICFYEDKMLSLSVLYSIDSKLKAALESRVWLKSGGYLIIEPTEALTVIDVNSGKYEAGKNPEAAYRKINLEAAQEVAIQLRLRNLSGIIIVDFINLQSYQDQRELLNYLKMLVKQDRVQTTVVDITPLGLVEITRKKVNKPLKEQFMNNRR